MTATSSQTADQAAAAAAVSLITAVRGGMRPEQVGYLAGLAVADLRRGADARGVEGDYAIGVLVGVLAYAGARGLDEWNRYEPGEADRWIRRVALLATGEVTPDGAHHR